MNEPTGAFERALLSLDRLAAEEILEREQEGRTTVQLVEELIVPAMERIGEGWRTGSIALSQIYMSGRICEELVKGILPPKASARKDHPGMAITTLTDYHMMGKRIVYSVLRAGGYELMDYGRTTVEDLVERVRNDRVRVLLISVLMLPSALKIKNVKTNLKKAGADVKIIVGGAPFIFDGELWKEVGADAMGESASEAMGIIEKISGGDT